MRVPGAGLTTFVAAFAIGISWAHAAGVGGRVISTTGSPIAGATVEAFARESAEQEGERRVAGRSRTPVLTVTAGPDGSFRLDSKRPFSWVQASAEGYAPEMSLADDGSPMQITLRAAALRRGVITAGGKPVGGALVLWFSSGGAERLTRSAPDGSFEAPDPSSAPGQLRVLHTDFVPHWSHLEPRQSQLDQQLEPGVKLAGSVVDDATGKPVADARVWLDGTWPLARTDAKGAFVIPHVQRTWTRVTARTSQAVGVSNRRAAPLVVRMKPSRILAGTVVDAGTRRPLAAASVVLEAPSGETLTAETDDRGRYEITGLPPGRYHPYAGRPGYVSGPTGHDRGPGIDLRSAPRARFDASLKRQPQIRGRVEDEQKRPVGGALVSVGFKDTPNIYTPNLWLALGGAFGGGVTTLTEADGTFALPLPPDDESHNAPPFMKDRPLAVLKQGFAAAQVPIGRRGDSLDPLLVRLTRGVELQGRVTGADGAPVAGVAITAAEDGSLGGLLFPTHMVLSSFKHEAWTTSDPSGSFSLRVHAGAHHLYFRKPGFAPRLARNHDTRAGQALDVVLEPAAPVRGRLSRPDGRGVAEARVSIASPIRLQEGEQATTSADGAFEITGLAAGVYQLHVQHRELGINLQRTIEAPTTDLQITLGPTVTLRGQVLDAASRQPVPHFSVRMSQGMGEPGAASRSLESGDASGTFTLEDVPAGEAHLMVMAEGYAPGKVDGLAVEEGTDPPPLEILLVGAVPIRGRVTDQGGEPLAEAVIATAGGERTAYATSDDDGEYELDGLPPGEWALHVSAQGHVGEKRTIDSRQSSRLDVKLKRGLTLSGEVVKAGVGVPNVAVRARSSVAGAGDDGAETDERGRFTLAGLVPGRYTVSARSRDQGSAKLQDVDPETAGPIRLTLDEGATAVLTGEVLGVPEGDGSATMVMATSEETGRSGHAPIDASHAFRMDDAPAGRVQVRAYVHSIDEGRSRASRAVELTLAPGSETETVLEFANDVTISGTVLRDGVGVPFLTVSFQGDGEGASGARTDARGAYQAMGLEPGSYRVHVSGEYVSFQTEYVVTGSAEFDIDITGGAIAGRVVRADGGAPLPGVEVSFFRLGGSENKPEGSATTTTQGTFAERSLREGRYRLITSKPGFGQEVRDVEVTRGGKAEVLLELSPADGVSVTVVDARDSRPLEAIVVVRDQARRIVANRHSGVDEQGLLNIPLADGSYLLSTSANGYGTVTVPVTAPTQGLRIGLTPGGTLVIESARDLKGRVRLVQPDGEEYVRCWCNGIAEIQLKGRRTSVENVTPGSYTVEIVDSVEPTEPRPVAIREGQTTTLSID